jgi:hypothetical protein
MKTFTTTRSLTSEIRKPHQHSLCPVAVRHCSAVREHVLE